MNDSGFLRTPTIRIAFFRDHAILPAGSPPDNRSPRFIRPPKKKALLEEYLL